MPLGMLRNKGRGAGEKRVFGVMVWFEKKRPVHGADGSLIDPVRLNPSNSGTHVGLLK